MSNLLDKASIILTPTAYNNGEALCVKPSDGSGDFDFSRNSAATRVNAQGLVENVQILSSNLVQNGDFSEEGSEEVSNGNFSQEGSEEITNGDFDGNANGWNVGDWTYSNGKMVSNGAVNLLQTGRNFTLGKFYKITYTIQDYVSGGVACLIGTSPYAETTERNENGVFTEIIECQTSGSLFILQGKNNFVGSIDNCSVREVGQDWTLENGWSIGEDKAISDGSGSIPNTDLIQSNVFTNGKSYKVTLEIKDYISGNLQLQNNTTNFPQSNGIHTIYSSTGSTSLILRSLSFIGSITNISVKEVGQNWDLGNWSVGDSLASSGATSFLQQFNVYTSTTSIYKSTFKARSVSGASVPLRLYDGSGNYQLFTITSSDFQDFELTRQRDGTNATLYIYNNSGAEIEVTNISVIEITDDTNLPRINYEGFSYQDALGSEQIVNGDFYTDSDWSMQASWSIANGKASYNGASNGHYIKQNASLIIGKEYIAKFDILDNSGNFRISVDGGTASYNNYTTGNGAYSFTFVASSSEFFIRASMGYSSDTFSIDNVSVKEYLGQEVVPDSGCGSWLFEPATTQLLTYSEDFSQWVPGGSTTIESGYLAPDGTNSAYKVSGSGSALSLAAGLTETTTRSIYARTVSGTGQANLCSYNSNTNNLFTITEEWQRFEVNSAIATGGANFYAVDFRGGTTLSEIIVWGANATNDQDYATSYIPSNGSTVTRNQDVCTGGGSFSKYK